MEKDNSLNSAPKWTRKAVKLAARMQDSLRYTGRSPKFEKKTSNEIEKFGFRLGQIFKIWTSTRPVRAKWPKTGSCAELPSQL